MSFARRMYPLAALISGAALAVLPPIAQAINKCETGGKITYQDEPCTESLGTVASELAKKKQYEAYYRKLDRMAAQGAGLLQRKPRAEAAAPVRDQSSSDESEPARTRRLLFSSTAQIDARIREDTERKNAQSVARLTNFLDKAAEGCGGKLMDSPTIGMTDETFRNCTLLARVGGVTQIVVSEEDNLPLRLYIFPSGQRVYTVDGVVTKLFPQ